MSNEFDEERLICPICGRQFQTLSRHLKLTHKLTDKDIQETYPGMKLRTDKYQAMQKASLDKGRETCWSNPEYKEKMRQASVRLMQEIRNDPEKLKKGQEASKEAIRQNRLANPEKYKEIDRARALKCWSNQSRRDKHSALLRSLWQQPEYRKKQSERFSNIVSSIWSDPQKVKEAGYGYYTHKTIDYNGHKFRSSWEVFLAKLLDESGIVYEYESKSIPYDYNESTHHYLIDFYIPDYNLIIEVKPNHFVNEVVQVKLDACSKLGYNVLLATEDNLFSDILNSIECCSTTIES